MTDIVCLNSFAPTTINNLLNKMSDLICVLTCECNEGKVYSTRSTFRSHLKSKRHTRWENQSDLVTMRVQYESELRRLKRRVVELEAQVKHLCVQPRQRRVSEALKKKVAHGQEWRCDECEQLLPSCYEVDHVVPLWKNGSNHVSNLRALCRNCHGSKTQQDVLLD
jgi:5-methylcytosine-specific restriction endonuclease McrA